MIEENDFLKRMIREYYQPEIERLDNAINRIESIYNSLCFSAPENRYIFINELGEFLQELKENKEWKNGDIKL